ncbi:L-fuculokinase [Gallibacterium salpingitidis]|uniref:L-fuculokinase n=1 Tax=Gallibacterium salpingitidis TaxID=505341 RepID=UPI0026702FE9|nr:L-fuculokinase [Gallibacterium salpingitidis]WKS99234.1 L-fuculokinase [Gallibacterium salpingitidis]
MAIALILDCGATNVRAIAMNDQGKMIASTHQINQTLSDIKNPDYKVWDFEQITRKLFDCAKQVTKKLADLQLEVDVIGVTTFGVDGAPFIRGEQCYPIISWKCPRTLPVMQSLTQEFDVAALYQRNGIGQYSFNTLYKLRWLQQNEADLYQKIEHFLFISSMLTYRLTGVMTTDRTMAGTSMMTNLQTENWDSEVLAFLGLVPEQLPPLVNAGEQIGKLLPDIARQLGISSGIPVVSCGHDTQFAILGSGAGLNQPVLSSGTWEILMARTQKAIVQEAFLSQGLTTEWDAEKGIFNPAVQWVGSGILEWVGKLLFSDCYGKNNYYQTMIAEAEAVDRDANRVSVQGNFEFSDCSLGLGQFSGLSMHTTRGEIYIAMLEYLANKLKSSLALLQQVGHFQADSLICVGGGAKNRLWNQIRANTIGLPIEVVQVSESTALGAAMTAFKGINVYQDLATAQQAMKSSREVVIPQS